MTSLDALKNCWESLAERDALWAILTDSSKAGGKWELAEFMATGEAEIETVVNHLAKINLTPDFCGSALDFGCGVGRLTQALAQRFASCVGLDISPSMIRKAYALNQYENCRYLASSSLDLPFPNESFSFIYSNIVLQHVPRRFSVAYLAEFIRVLVPGGVLAFGVQDAANLRIASRILIRTRQMLRIRSRVKAMLGLIPGTMQMHCLPEGIVRQALGPSRIADIQFTHTAEKAFNGKLLYLDHPPKTGYIGKQYCVRKEP